MRNHSPGPWRHVRDRSLSDYDDSGSKGGAASIETDHGCVQQIAHVTHDSLYPDETNANIRLIVAAPDLLAALYQIDFVTQDQITHERIVQQVQELARGAIARVNGPSSHIPPSRPPVPRTLVCPDCGNDRMLYVEDIGCAREVESLDENGILWVHGFYTTDGYDDGTNPRLQCSRCVKEFAVPEKVEFD
jgi:hypothetical protein